METKQWYESKTVWANVIGAIATIGTVFGVDLGLGPEQQGVIVAGVLTVVNLILRFKTDKGIGNKDG